MDYIKKGRELVKRMLNSEQRATCESDGTESAYINFNWLIKQRASLWQNAHLEREEIMREAESRQSLVEELICCYFFSVHIKSLSSTIVRMLLNEVEASHLTDLSLALPVIEQKRKEEISSKMS